MWKAGLTDYADLPSACSSGSPSTRSPSKVFADDADEMPVRPASSPLGARTVYVKIP